MRTISPTPVLIVRRLEEVVWVKTILLTCYSSTNNMTLGQETPAGLEDMLRDLLRFPLMEALTGRRSRRFCMGAEIPDGVFAFKSKHKSIPLSELEQLLLLSTMGGVTGWHFAIMRHNLSSSTTYRPRFL